ncbi:MAG: carboxymuconolactone decarboxylase family protein [Rhizobiales bacterium]|nr:carboxymuconolactone decarboxylase family protein [Hyphomicrobiales bacterium]
MALFEGLGKRPTALSIFEINKAASRHLVNFHHEVLRAPGPLTDVERELIATYVSGLNGCKYCYGTHSAGVVEYGIKREVLDAMFENLETSGVDPKMVPLLKYAGILTQDMTAISEEDAQAVYAAGWSEDALHNAILVACTFNFMNRLLEGHGVIGNPALYEVRGKMLTETGYIPLLEALKD